MKNSILTIAFLLCSMIALGQEEKALGVLESDTTWLKEVIKFPIGFAPEIKYKEGYEDLRFAKKWRDKTHEDFWCYLFAWHIKRIEKLTVKDLEQQVKFYYDGLMKAVNKKKDFEVPETTVLFIKAENDNMNVDYIGKIRVYDSFTSEAMMTLNVQVKVHYCEDTNRSNVIFRLSPQDFNHEIWQRFKEITLKADVCQN
ncbi:MAG: hypothetical protein V7719_16550 [Psychroserpens sp.]|uniref:hypothetical protein n=1 Tax=Psychroserpens sp. TaxID=2020870 RepID=UPI0030026E79